MLTSIVGPRVILSTSNSMNREGHDLAGAISRRIRNLLERIKSHSQKRRNDLESRRVSHYFHRIPSFRVIWVPQGEKRFQALCLHRPAYFSRSHRIR